MDFKIPEPRGLSNIVEENEDVVGDDSLLLGPSVSVDGSSTILRNFYNETSNAMHGKWIFEESDISISMKDEDLLGRGNFGEVRIALWKNVQVACKNLEYNNNLNQNGQGQVVKVLSHTGTYIDMPLTLEKQRENMAYFKTQQAEVEALTKLRHPNIVQLFGICCSAEDKYQPSYFLTELMNCSLYDVLEIKKIPLESVEILDIIHDIASGLHYLHSLVPRIVHKNLSCKNVLLKGNVAKLTDFGLSGQDGSQNFVNQVGFNSSGKTVVGATLREQDASLSSVFTNPESESNAEHAKVAGTSSKRDPSQPLQDYEKGDKNFSTRYDTKVPIKEEVITRVHLPPVISASAIPYLAPEIVMGTKFMLTEKIDIYSFGVILLHMITGKMPEQYVQAQREDYKKEAESLQPIFSTLFESTLKVSPLDRCSIKEVLTEITSLRGNDRHYPLQRRAPNIEHDIGVILRRYIREQMKDENALSHKRYQQMRDMLRAEGTRWHKEGKINDFLKQQLEDSDTRLNDVSDQYETTKNELRKMKEVHRKLNADYESFVTYNEEKIRKLNDEKNLIGGKYFTVDQKYRECSSALQDTSKALENTSEQLVQMQETLIRMSDKDRAMESDKRRMNNRIEELQEEVEDLEMRLEQALMRWKQEQEVATKEKKDYKKLSDNTANIVKENESLKAEHKVLEELIRKHEAETLPEDVIRKIQVMEDNLVKSTEANEKLVQMKSDLEAQITELTTNLEVRDLELGDTKSTLEKRNKTIEQRDAHILQLKEELSTTEKQMNDSEDRFNEKEAGYTMKIDKLTKWVESLEAKAKATAALGVSTVVSDSPVKPGKELSPVSKDNGKVDKAVSEGKESTEADAQAAVEEDEEDGLSQFSDNSQPVPQRKFNFADLAAAKKQTEEHQKIVRAINKDRKEKETKAKIRAADSMAKARVKQCCAKEEESSGEGVAALIELMFETIDDIHICWRGCRAIRPIVLESDKPAKKSPSSKRSGSDENVFSDPNSPMSVREVSTHYKGDLMCLDILKKHRWNSHLDGLCQGQAVQLLGALAFGDDLVRRRAGENGAMDMVIYAMEHYGIADEKVLLHCLTTITNLAHNSQDNRHRFLDANGLEILTDAMEVQINSPKVQRQGCWALLTLAGSDETARLVAQGGGSRTLMTLVKALLQHPNDGGVQQFGLWAASNMALAGGDISRRLKKAGMAEICRIAIETHPHDSEVIRQARHAIGVLN